MTETMDFFTASALVAKAKEMDLPTMELVFRLENSGEDFYNALADRIDNDEAAELLRRNGREERGHALCLQRHRIKLGEEWKPSPEVLERSAFRCPTTSALMCSRPS
jgi:hypothetical protein